MSFKLEALLTVDGYGKHILRGWSVFDQRWIKKENKHGTKKLVCNENDNKDVMVVKAMVMMMMMVVMMMMMVVVVVVTIINY